MFFGQTAENKHDINTEAIYSVRNQAIFEFKRLNYLKLNKLKVSNLLIDYRYTFLMRFRIS
jgi:hypothetical protein